MSNEHQGPRGQDRPAPSPLPPGTPTVHLRSPGIGEFIYNKMVDRVDGEPSDGDLVAVVDRRGYPLGWGYYNSRSTIVVRMYSFGPVRPAEEELVRRVRQAVELRRDVLRLEESTDAYRLIHAEGDHLPGLIADRFGQYVVLELFSLAMFQRLEQVQDAIVDAGVSVKDFIVRADKAVTQHEGFRLDRLHGPDDARTTITEHGVRFHVGMLAGHKTGFFCDQRENRLAMTAFTKGRNVLDVCCYTGGFACYAAGRGGAASVTAVDLDENALTVAQANAQLNEVAVDIQHADAFDFLRRAGQQGRQWDVVVVDPSKFVPNRAAIDAGLRKYYDLNRLAAGVVAPEGLLLTCSCSGLVDQPTFVRTVSRAIRGGGRGAQVLRVSGAGPDHPVAIEAPEGAYLKAVWARVH